MTFKRGTKVIWIDQFSNNPEEWTLQEGTVALDGQVATLIVGKEFSVPTVSLIPDTKEFRELLEERIDVFMNFFHEKEKLSLRELKLTLEWVKNN